MQSKSFVPLLVTLYFGAFIAGFNENLVNVALMSIMNEYGVDSVSAQWLVSGYMVVATVMVSCMAFLYRRFKLRTLFFTAAVLSLAGSVMGLLSNSFVMLMAARLVQALGTGIFIPMMMNTILAVTPKNRLGTFMSIGSCTITFGPAFAPVVCGALVTCFGWHSVFVVPIAAMVVLMVMGAVFVRNLQNEKAHLDALSVVLSAVMLTALVYGMSQIVLSSVQAATGLAIGVAAGALFLVRQKRCDHPLIEVAPLSEKRFLIPMIMVFVAMMTTFSLSVLMPLYYEGAMGMTALMAGVVMLVPVLVNAGTALLGGAIMDKRGEWPLLPAGFAVLVAGTVALAAASPSMALPLVFAASVLVYGGVGLVLSPSQTSGLKCLPPQQNPHGVALASTILQISACIGPSLYTGIMSSVQGGALAGGASQGTAAASGFAAAIAVAAAIGLVGLLLAGKHVRTLRRDAVALAAGGAQGADAAPAANAGSNNERFEEAAEGSGFASAPASSGSDSAHAAADGCAASAKLADIMQRDPYVIAADAPVGEAMRLLADRKVSGIPVVDNAGLAVGFVSDGDIMRYLADKHPLVTSAYSVIALADNGKFDDRLRELVELPVSVIATDRVVSVAANASLSDVCMLLAKHKLKKVPVLDDGRVVGTVNRSDVLRYAMEQVIDADN